MSAYRLAALVLGASLLHLNLVRADSVCATHADHARQPASSHQAAARDHASEHHASSESPADTCETPSQPDCCQALASCSLVLGSDEGTSVAVLGFDHDLVTAAVSHAPRSRLAAPDPPPPKV